MLIKAFVKKLSFISGSLILAVSGMGMLSSVFTQGAFADTPPNPSPIMFVAADGNDHNPCTRDNPCKSINYVISQLPSSGGTVNLENRDGGNYRQDIRIDGKTGISIVSDFDLAEAPTVTFTNAHKTGLAIIKSTSIKIEGINFQLPTKDSKISTALHIKKSNTVDIQRDTFSGNGPGSSTPPSGTGINGVTIVSSTNVNLQNVAATNFSRNGFAVISQGSTTSAVTSNITFNNITSNSNGWYGLAFHTVGDDHSSTGGSVGGSSSITGVSFTGPDQSMFDNNSYGGILIQGSDDSDMSSLVAPVNTVTGPSGAPLDLSNSSLADNGLSNTLWAGKTGVQIINYQAAGVSAMRVHFTSTANGIVDKTGTAMDPVDQSIIQNQEIVDGASAPGSSIPLGIVTFY